MALWRTVLHLVRLQAVPRSMVEVTLSSIVVSQQLDLIVDDFQCSSSSVVFPPNVTFKYGNG